MSVMADDPETTFKIIGKEMKETVVEKINRNF